jgi:hypothetical protein
MVTRLASVVLHESLTADPETETVLSAPRKAVGGGVVTLIETGLVIKSSSGPEASNE